MPYLQKLPEKLLWLVVPNSNKYNYIDSDRKWSAMIG